MHPLTVILDSIYLWILRPFTLVYTIYFCIRYQVNCVRWNHCCKNMYVLVYRKYLLQLLRIRLHRDGVSYSNRGRSLLQQLYGSHNIGWTNNRLWLFQTVNVMLLFTPNSVFKIVPNPVLRPKSEPLRNEHFEGSLFIIRPPNTITVKLVFIPWIINNYQISGQNFRTNQSIHCSSQDTMEPEFRLISSTLLPTLGYNIGQCAKIVLEKIFSLGSATLQVV